MGPPREPSEAGRVGRGGRNKAGVVLAAGGDGAEFLPARSARCGQASSGLLPGPGGGSAPILHLLHQLPSAY